MLLTIFTPTYNRAHLLPQLFESLQNQDSFDFEWLIVDDGSTDATRELVEQFKVKADFSIRYIFQENQGKHVAINKAFEKTNTPFIMTVDSDDILMKNALMILSKKIRRILNEPKMVAICSPIKRKSSTDLLINQVIKEDFISNSFELENKHKIKGEFSFVLKTEIVKAYPYPVFPGEKFMNESYLYKRLSERYNYLYISESLVEAEYQEDGLSANFKRILNESPKGAALTYQYLMNNSKYSMDKRVQEALNYWDYETLGGNLSFVQKLKKIKSPVLKLKFIIKKFI